MTGLAGFRVNWLGSATDGSRSCSSFLLILMGLDQIYAVPAPRFPSKLRVYSFVASTLVLEMYFLQWFM